MPHPSAPPHLVAGALIAGKYRLIGRLGQGAMEIVWSAVNEIAGRKVALKLIAGSDPSLRERLLREARSCGALKHENIVDILDVAWIGGGEPCLVMELLAGESVDALLATRRRPLVRSREEKAGANAGSRRGGVKVAVGAALIAGSVAMGLLVMERFLKPRELPVTAAVVTEEPHQAGSATEFVTVGAASPPVPAPAAMAAVAETSAASAAVSATPPAPAAIASASASVSGVSAARGVDKGRVQGKALKMLDAPEPNDIYDTAPAKPTSGVRKPWQNVPAAPAKQGVPAVPAKKSTSPPRPF